jgi:hypothetical protein
VSFLHLCFLPFDILETFDSTLSWTDAGDYATRNNTQREQECKGHVIVSTWVDNRAGDKRANERGCLSNNTEKTENGKSDPGNQLKTDWTEERCVSLHIDQLTPALCAANPLQGSLRIKTKNRFSEAKAKYIKQFLKIVYDIERLEIHLYPGTLFPSHQQSPSLFHI